MVSCLVLLAMRAAQGAASEVCLDSEPCSQWRVLMPQLRLTAFRLTGFIRWSCSCEAKAPARAPGGAGFKGQRPLRTVSPPLEANSASPACYCWSHPRWSSLSLSAVSHPAPTHPLREPAWRCPILPPDSPAPPPFPLPCLSYFFSYIATCSHLAICSYLAICSAWPPAPTSPSPSASAFPPPPTCFP